jgi:hypothetical protein
VNSAFLKFDHFEAFYSPFKNVSHPVSGIACGKTRIASRISEIAPGLLPDSGSHPVFLDRIHSFRN